MKKPQIVCLCGSTRFADEHSIARWNFEKTGDFICLMINILPEWYFASKGFIGNSHFGEAYGNREILDNLHKRKIDLCDFVFVVNVNGYIGDSTKSEIDYAKQIGKPVQYLVSPCIPRTPRHPPRKPETSAKPE